MRLQKRSSWKVGCVSDSSSNIIKAAATLCKANWHKKGSFCKSVNLWLSEDHIANTTNEICSLSVKGIVTSHLGFPFVHEACGMSKVHLIEIQFTI